MRTAVPGPDARARSERLRELEPPGINTLYGGRANILWQEARGSNVLDTDGNRYLDLTTGFGVAAIGHRHPRVGAAVRRQSGRLLHALGDAIGHPLRIELAERLRQIAPMPRASTYFAVSGADAVEIAIKTALLHHRAIHAGAVDDAASRILVFEPSYHGLTSGALNLGSRREFRAPFEAHLHERVDRLPFGVDPAEIERLLARRPGFAAAVVEPIVGREGMIVPPAGWLGRLAELCREHGLLFVADEIFTGFGHTGRWFAIEHETLSDGSPLVPDLVCCGKALGGGLPIAAVLGRKELLEVWSTPGEALHTATFVANPVSCAAALAVLDVLESDRLLDRASELAGTIETRLRAMAERYRNVLVEARGRGLLWGLELRSRDDAGRLVERAWSRGILLLSGGPEGRVAQLVPALTIRKRQLFYALDVLETILAGLEQAARDPGTEDSDA